MLRTILVISIYLAVCSAGPLFANRANDSYIVGGSEAAQGEVPWTVSYTYSGTHRCGGSIISKRTILTAAHCVDGVPVSALQVRVGSLSNIQGGVLINVARSVIHAQYDAWSNDNDVAVLILSSDIPIDGTNVVAVNLAAVNSDPAPGTILKVAGWGRLVQNGASPSTLYKVEVPVVERTSCHNAYVNSPYQLIVTDNMVCAGLEAGGKDSCNGDSGGPLTKGNTQVGIVSWGIGCALAGYAGVYTRVGSLRTWIDSNTV